MANTKSRTDIHKNYGSLEEFETDINKLADAIENVHDVALSTNLPPAIVEGLMYSGLIGLSMGISDKLKAMEHKKALGELFAAFTEFDEEKGE